MSKDKISDYSATANSNTDIAGINIDEGCAPSGINDAIRTLMKQLKDFQQGTNGDSFNGPVGSTTRSTGAFTSISTTGDITIDNGSADGGQLLLASSGYSNWGIDNYSGNFRLYYNTSEKMRLDNSGNLGLGVTPSAWSNGKAIDVGAVGNGLLGWGASDISLCAGGYYNAGWKWAATNSLGATHYEQYSGAHYWSVAAPTSHTAGNPITFTQAMTLDASGNLSLASGTLSLASGNLSLSGSAPIIQISSNKYFGVGSSLSGSYASTDLAVWNGAAGNLAFLTNATERARIDSSGNLLVGTTSTTIGTANFGFKVQADSLTTWSRNVNGTSAVAQIYGNAGEFRLYGNGNAQNTNNSYGAISDIKLKENITDATPKLAQLQQVRVVNYNLIGSEVKQIGVIAQELEQVFPSMIEETQDYDADGNALGTTTKGVKYSVFVPMLIKAIQEMKTIIDQQAERITALEAK